MSASAPSSRADPAPAPLAGWHVFTLRPVGQAGGLLALLRRAGARADNLGLVRLQAPDAQAIAERLARIGPAQAWVFASPAAARSCARIVASLAPELFAPGGTLAQAAARGSVFAPGPGTAGALASLGIAPVAVPPTRLDSEGLLALPALAAPLRGTVVLVGAPGGRGLLEHELTARGARVEPLHVYQRQPVAPAARSLLALVDCPRSMLLVSSGQSLDRLCQVLAPDQLDRLRGAGHLVLAGERLRAQASALGFACVSAAGSAQPKALIEAAIARAARLDDAAGRHDSVSMAP
jgi:uroporphyrinogen-III synthase